MFSLDVYAFFLHALSMWWYCPSTDAQGPNSDWIHQSLSLAEVTQLFTWIVASVSSFEQRLWLRDE